MARSDKPKLADDRGGPLTFPPGLAPQLAQLATMHGLELGWSSEQLGELLTLLFFASLRPEEHEHHPIRVVLAPQGGGVDPTWRVVRVRAPLPLNARQLVRLSRAASSERIHVVVGAGPRLSILGLGYEPIEDSARAIKLWAPEPGSLEIWLGRKRLLDYAQGRVMEPPENVLLSPGIIRARIAQLAAGAELPKYVECLAALVRHMTDHAYGGILIVGPHDLDAAPIETGFVLDPGMSVGSVLERLARLDELPAHTSKLVEENLRAELDRTLGEVGRLSALDGATVLDASLNVLGFGLILPVRDDVKVLEAMDAAPTRFVAFPLTQYGARHRAAASYAASNATSLVFVASADGDITCMIRDPEHEDVLAWRFRSGDLSHD